MNNLYKLETMKEWKKKCDNLEKVTESKPRF